MRGAERGDHVDAVAFQVGQGEYDNRGEVDQPCLAQGRDLVLATSVVATDPGASPAGEPPGEASRVSRSGSKMSPRTTKTASSGNGSRRTLGALSFVTALTVADGTDKPRAGRS